MKSRVSKPGKRKETRRLIFSGDKEMILALADEQGFRGLRGEEIENFSGLPAGEIEKLSRELEAEGRIRILGFSPLHLVAREGLDFLLEKILSFLKQAHAKIPGAAGVPLLKLQKRFGLPKEILSLALKTLQRRGLAREWGESVQLAGHEVRLTPAEEKMMARLEGLCLAGKLRTTSAEELQKQLRISQPKLARLLSLLVEKMKIVESRDGFFLHSHWLDDIIRTVREPGRKELSVAEFKQLTGLTRKYAIPLLELLDEMGVTKRKGPVREIL
jgi:selenocysteine-specific elongation factor